MRLISLLLVALILPVSSAFADECSDIRARYKAKLDSAKSESPSFRRITLDYLKTLEAEFAKCLSGKEGQLLVGERKKFEASKMPPTKRKTPKKDKDTKDDNDSDLPKSRRESSDDSPTYQTGWTGSRSRLHPASAALLSLIVPGMGQAVNNQPASAWLFFLGTGACYGIAGGLVAGAVSAKKLDNGMLTGAVILAILGGAVHIVSVIHAGVTAR